MGKYVAGLKAVKDYFGMNLEEMKAELTNGGLTDDDKAELGQLCAAALNAQGD